MVRLIHANHQHNRPLHTLYQWKDRKKCTFIQRESELSVSIMQKVVSSNLSIYRSKSCYSEPVIQKKVLLLLCRNASIRDIAVCCDISQQCILKTLKKMENKRLFLKRKSIVQCRLMRFGHSSVERKTSIKGIGVLCVEYHAFLRQKNIMNTR